MTTITQKIKQSRQLKDAGVGGGGVGGHNVLG